MSEVTIAEIDACLPQTQCTRCSYPSCTAYAEAVYEKKANINQCPPGGDVSIAKLATLTSQITQPLDTSFGEFQPKALAFIHEDRCIGCVLCIKACPVDAIVGANKRMHTVIQAHCTGCELCLPVCPTDCIEMQAPTDKPHACSDWPGYSNDDIRLAKLRFEKRQQRLSRQTSVQADTNVGDAKSRQQAIMDAVKRRKKQIRS